MNPLGPTLPEIRAYLVRQRMSFEDIANSLREVARAETKDKRIDEGLREKIKTIATMIRSAAKVMDGMVLTDIEERMRRIPDPPREEEE